MSKLIDRGQARKTHRTISASATRSTIRDLPGCLTQGEMIEETIKNINEARELWLETVYDLGRSIPLPSE